MLSWAIWGHLEPSWKPELLKQLRLPGTAATDRHLGQFWGPKLAYISLFGGSFFGPVFGPFLGNFGGHFGARSAQEGAKMGSREPLRASKTPKSAFAKTLKNLQFFNILGVQGCLRQPQKSQEGSQEAPKELQNLKKKGSTNGPQNYQLLDQFWNHFGGVPKGDQKWDHFWNPLTPHLRGRGVAILRIKQEWWNCYGYWNYIRQKKGRDKDIRRAILIIFPTFFQFFYSLSLFFYCFPLFGNIRNIGPLSSL